MSTFIERLEPPPGSGPRLAVKDMIDVEGVPTTAASRPVAAQAEPADHDAAVILRARAAGARIVGKTNLHELAYGGTGINEFFGTPENPIDPLLIPGGSSSGSAVAVATGEADIAFGTDTAGSVRTPSACCGTVGLKTTWGSLPTDGVRPLAPSLDSIGPMARDVAGVAQGLALLDPAFDPTTAVETPTRVARLRLEGVDPVVDQAVDRALAEAGIVTTDVRIDAWELATQATVRILLAEATIVNASLLAEHGDQLGADVAERIELGANVRGSDLLDALRFGSIWSQLLTDTIERFGALAMPTLPVLAPLLSAPEPRNAHHSAPVNLAGVPALALPVPTEGPLPTSIQLVGPHHDEPRLLALGTLIEAAVG